MHINDLRGLKYDRLVELAFIFDVPVNCTETRDQLAAKIVKWHADLPPLYRANYPQVDRFLGAFR